MSLTLFIIAAITFSYFTFYHGHGSGRSAVISNLMQLSLANLMYAADYDEHLPPAGNWLDVIEPYHKNTVIPHDPTIKDAKQGEFGFAFYEPVSLFDLSSTAKPEDVPMVFQSVLMGKNAHSDLRTLPYLPRNENGLNYVAFCDGHVKGFPSTWPGEPIVIEPKK